MLELAEVYNTIQSVSSTLNNKINEIKDLAYADLETAPDYPRAIQLPITYAKTDKIIYYINSNGYLSINAMNSYDVLNKSRLVASPSIQPLTLKIDPMPFDRFTLVGGETGPIRYNKQFPYFIVGGVDGDSATNLNNIMINFVPYRNEPHIEIKSLIIPAESTTTLLPDRSLWPAKGRFKNCILKATTTDETIDETTDEITNAKSSFYFDFDKSKLLLPQYETSIFAGSISGVYGESPYFTYRTKIKDLRNKFIKFAADNRYCKFY